jgi:hypothetical protein
VSLQVLPGEAAVAACDDADRTFGKVIATSVNSGLPNRLSLDEADDGVGNVRLLERGNLVGGHFHVHRCESVVKMLQLGGADDRRGDYRLGQ